MKQVLNRPAWSASERAAWRPPPELTPAQWAERNRTLPRGQTFSPGRWRNELAPYLVGIMNLAAAPGIERIDVMKASQIGVSEAFRNVLGFWADTDPDPCGITLPNRPKGREIIENRIIPMFRETPALKRWMSPRAHDTKKEQIRLLNGFILHLMWSGSPAAMASDPMRRVICDEVDKHAACAGQETDSISLTWRRLETYEDRIQVNVSTPTNRWGRIYQLWEEDPVHLFYFVPCPHCGTYQRLVWAGLKFERPPGDKHQAADRMRRSRHAVWYECSECGKKIKERDKAAMIRGGRWSTESGQVEAADGTKYADAEKVPIWPAHSRVGVQAPGWYCLWRSWAVIAAEFIEAEGDLGATFDWRTNTCGEPFEQRIERADSSVFSAKSARAALAEGVVPAWAWCLIAAIDTQKDHFWAVLRAWGSGMRSQRIWHGRLESFAELDDVILSRTWQNEDDKRLPMRCGMTLIDTGGTREEGASQSRTMEVYRWCVARRHLVRAIKGDPAPKAGARIWRGRGYHQTAPAPAGGRKRRGTRELPLWHLDEESFEDELAEMIMRGLAEDDDRPEGWLLNKRDDEEYNRHLAGKQKVIVREGRRHRERWVPMQSGGRYDLRDCEKMVIAGAYMASVHLLPDADALERQRKALEGSSRKHAKRQQEAGGWTPNRWEI